MFQRVDEARFISGEHDILRFWEERGIFRKLLDQNRGKPKWSFLDGPITANNPMGVHHAWGRTYKDAYQRFFAMTGHELRYQNGFDCQGLWVEVEVEKELGLGTKKAINEFGIDRFVRACKQRVLKFAARQTEQSIRLGYWMEWDQPDELRKLAEAIGESSVQSPVSSAKALDSQLSTLNSPPTHYPLPTTHSYRTARGQHVTGDPEAITARLGNPEWGGSYFTFSTENNETIWTFLKKCFDRKKIYRGHDVMPWGGRSGSAYSQMEVADGRRLTTHRSCFVRFPIIDKYGELPEGFDKPNDDARKSKEFLLVWTTTPWTLTSNVACAVNVYENYVRLVSKRDGAIYYIMEKNLNSQRLEGNFKDGFGSDGPWPVGVPKLKTISQIFKEQGGYELDSNTDGSIKTIEGRAMENWLYVGPFDELGAQKRRPPTSDVSALMSAWSARVTNEYANLRNFVDSASHDLRVCARDVHRTFQEVGIDLIKMGVDHGWYSPIKTPNTSDDVDELLRGFGLNADLYGKWRQVRCADFITLDSVNAMLGLKPVTDCDSTSTLEWDQLSGWPTAKSRRLSIPFLNEECDRQEQLFKALATELATLPGRSPRESHRVINGGRDSKGNPNVVHGEGTGIVHIAPGCGDIDHKLGRERALPPIAPLREDGTYDEDFGEFTGREAIDPATTQLVFDKLKEQGYWVADEKYPHVFPFCWRTGEELVSRLVDEWFINMDWRDEIKAVTKAIEWLPASIQGQEREVEWLTTMRDWMISKKRFWGLALPIWVNPDDPSDFEVIGSLAELKERAQNGGEGWDQFEGHTPHKPWIDAVKIRSHKTGQLLSRIEDVGNPWLDAGIVPFSTLNYGASRDEGLGSRGEDRGSRIEDRGQDPLDPKSSILNPDSYPLPTTHYPLRWRDWFPADLVTECFPGQFRNWFYSLLSLATMMRYDETDDPLEKRPFKTLLGHRLVMDEHGNEMHKSKGTAIWFEEAAEQIGVDTIRWMYLAQNPAADLKFGLRHKDQPVTLETPDGPITTTKEGLPTCKVTSTPADEIRRQVLIPLWNSYAFFVNYAVLDGFDPSLPQTPLAERPEIDRWILSRLQELTQTSRDAYESFDAPRAMQASAEFIDDLSNWYIRRNRRRFWRARTSPGVATPGHSGGDWDTDKLAAYQTLYEVLVTLTKLLAPAIPFLSERMYQNLVASRAASAPGPDAGSRSVRRLTPAGSPESVHLCVYPEVDAAKLDPDLNWQTHQVQALVTLGHRLRDVANQRVRQPLAELRFACADARQAEALARYADVIADELNVKLVTRAANLDDLVSYTYKPNLKTLGPKYGKLLNAIKTTLPSLDPASLAPLRSGQPVTVTIDGQSVALDPADVMVSTAQATDWACADDAGIQVALSTKLTPELIHEGMARDLIRHVQQLRKDADLEENDRIVITCLTAGAMVAEMLNAWSESICRETRANAIETADASGSVREVTVGDDSVGLSIRPVQTPR